MSLVLLRAGVQFHPSSEIRGARARILFDDGVKVGKRCILDVGENGKITLSHGVWISSDVEMQTDDYIAIGGGTTIQRRCSINGNVKMGSECILAPNVFISSGSHPFRAAPELSIREQERRIAAGELQSDELDRPVIIGDDCWLGTNAVICPGVTIGSGTIIGANSVVTCDISPRSIYAGCPARKIGDR